MENNMLDIDFIKEILITFFLAFIGGLVGSKFTKWMIKKYEKKYVKRHEKG